MVFLNRCNQLLGKEVYFVKTIKMLPLLIAVCLMVIAVPSFAFHNGSQLKCNLCHTMHYSEGGEAPSSENGYPVEGDGGPNPVLLVKANVTDLCLQCHKDSGYAGAPSIYNSTPGSGTLLPGGDFGYSAHASGGNAMSDDIGRGHNPFGASGDESVEIDQDTLNGGSDGITPPGNDGTPLEAGEFTCVQCHQVHGPESGGSRAYGYRLLLKTVNENSTISLDSIASGAWIKDTTVTPNVVIAGPDGADLTLDESTSNHNVYKGGFSNWCSSCHPNFHGADESDPDTGNGSDLIRHPTHTAIGDMNTKYGSYSYLYPLIKVGGNWTKTSQGSGNVATTDEVMCLTCHKAHASANPDALRWDPSQASTLGQCNKCHQKGGGI
jgi:hypothetical protein